MTHSSREIAATEAGCVVALHSSLNSGHQWARLVELLGSQRQVLAPAISGYGPDAPSIDPPGTLAHEVELLTDRLARARGPIHLVGHSYGGAIAFKMATDSPYAHRVQSLTLIEPVLPTLLLADSRDRALHDEFAQLGQQVRDDLFNAAPQVAIDRFVAYWADAGTPPRLSPALRQHMIRQADKLLFDFAAALAEQEVERAARAIKVPTLLFSGGLSPAMTQRIALRLADTIDDSQLWHLPAAGHMLAISHAAQINAEIARHIAETDLGTWERQAHAGDPHAEAHDVHSQQLVHRRLVRRAFRQAARPPHLQ